MHLNSGTLQVYFNTGSFLKINRNMKIIVIGNYPPRKCGIATFTENLVNSILLYNESASTPIEVEIIAMNDGGKHYDYPDIVKRTINDNNKASYLKAAKYINESSANLCLLQHEYGIFGGNSGLLLLPLIKALKIPLITTLHTVLQYPNYHQREVLKVIANYSSKIIVMCQKAITLLEESFGIRKSKIEVIEHGVPNFKTLISNTTKMPKKWQQRQIIITFGLLNRNKGIETAIRAIPQVAAKHPDVLYVIMGKTHPNIIKEYGEEYRDELKILVKELNIERNVEFVDKFVSEKELATILSFADIYITPYQKKAQITSGTLAYAVGAGLAVVSTPYWHAEEILSNDTGILFDFGDYQMLSSILNNLLDDKEKLNNHKARAGKYGIKNMWPIIGERYVNVFSEIIKNTVRYMQQIDNPLPFPEFSIDAIERLTNNTGIVQHSQGIIPYYKEGYSLDDNVRAIIMMQMAINRFNTKEYNKYLIKFLSFLLFMRNEDGIFKNLLSYSHQTNESKLSEDTYGRSMWALGYLIYKSNDDSIFREAHDIFHQSLRNVQHLTHTRGFANSIFGFYYYIKKFPDQILFINRMILLADKLCAQYKKHSISRWNWFDTEITYDNGILPAALYLAYEITNDKKYLEIADESTAFLEDICFSKPHLSLVGNKTWKSHINNKSEIGQQPVDAAAMVILYDTIHRIKKDNKSREMVKKSFLWFLGDNDLNIPVYDTQNHGCYDGIEELEVNQNQGAESNIAYLLSWLIAEPYFKN